jgi:pantoate--beta-alanine ligase
MGALHPGHTALFDRARSIAGADGMVIASIFVNPTQFGPKEDFSRYPRPFVKDQRLCRDHGVNLLFAPTQDEMYQSDFSCWVDESSVSLGLCGGARPGHFRGVCTVVLKLFQILQPHIAVFGRKDFQQCAVIARMVRDLNVPVKLVFAPTVRETDGLALSSRNAYLTPSERGQAPALYAALLEAEKRTASGEKRASLIRSLITRRLNQCPDARIDYVSIVDSETLRPLKTITAPATAAIAVFFGRTRLIDNIQLC